MTTTAEQTQIIDGSRQLAIEIKTQREIALSRPRDEKAIYQAALAELEFAPEFAEDAFYAIPFKDKDAEDGKTMIEGLSVVASRAIARRWGNCATAARIGAESDDAFEVEGIFADFETNAFFRATVRVPKSYIPRGTKIPTPLRADRLNLAIQAGLSKAERNATMKGLPEYLKSRYFTAAKKIAGAKGKGVKTDAERLAEICASFNKWGVTPDRVAEYIKTNLNGVATDEIIGTMRGVFNSLKEGQAKAEDVFTEPKKEESRGPVSAENLTGAAK